MQKPHYPHPILAREGWPHIAIAVVVALLATLLFGGWSLIFWVIAVFVVQFFRDPPRHVPQQANAVLSPADGRIVVVERTQDPYANREALKISVFMNVFNVHSNRSPVDGRIRHVEYFPGKFVNADLDKASLENERNALLIETDQGVTVTCVQVAGLVARRILCYVAPGDRLARGQRYGFIRFGSRVDVYLPLDAQPRVVIGDKVSATSTILADLARADGTSGSPRVATAAQAAPAGAVPVTGAVSVSAAVAELVPGAIAAAADPAPAAPGAAADPVRPIETVTPVAPVDPAVTPVVPATPVDPVAPARTESREPFIPPLDPLDAPRSGAPVPSATPVRPAPLASDDDTDPPVFPPSQAR